MEDTPRVHNAVWQPRNKKGQFKRVVPKSGQLTHVASSIRGKKVIVLDSDDDDAPAQLNPNKLTGSQCNYKARNSKTTISGKNTGPKRTNKLSPCTICYHSCNLCLKESGPHNTHSEEASVEHEGVWDAVSLKFKKAGQYIYEEIHEEFGTSEFNKQPFKATLDWLFDEVVCLISSQAGTSAKMQPKKQKILSARK